MLKYYSQLNLNIMKTLLQQTSKVLEKEVLKYRILESSGVMELKMGLDSAIFTVLKNAMKKGNIALFDVLCQTSGYLLQQSGINDKINNN
jgi:hypothetical protein